MTCSPAPRTCKLKPRDAGSPAPRSEGAGSPAPQTFRPKSGPVRLRARKEVVAEFLRTQRRLTRDELNELDKLL